MAALREWFSRLHGSAGRGRADRELQEELKLHLELAAEEARRTGHSPADADRAARLHAGGMAQAMDALRDRRGLPWLDALASDVVFGWRQVKKQRTGSIVAIVSLGLAIGATTAALRLVDAVFIRPLPVADPDRLFAVATTFVDGDNREDVSDDFDYPTFREYVRLIGDRAEPMLVGTTARQPVMFGAADSPEITFRQFVSGNVFATFGLSPAAGRLLTRDDDRVPGGHPVAVISYDYWTRRFGRSAAAVGTTFRAGDQQYEIVGVAPRGFTGTEPGAVTDLFLPSLMNVRALDSPGWSWFRLWIRPARTTSAEEVRQILQAKHTATQRERIKSLPADTPPAKIAAYLKQEVRLLPAGSGVSGTQKTFRGPLVILAALAAVVLLIACANVANLMTAQAIARAREMALRISIGADRWRLIQLVLVESLLVAIAASAVGTVFATWAAPTIVSMLATADRPVRVILEPDGRAAVLGIALTVVVTVLFGLAPALRASSVRPVGSLKGDDVRAHRRLTNALAGVQLAFCVFLIFVAGLFVATFDRLSNLPLGFAHERLLLIPTETRSKLGAEAWMHVAREIRAAPGVESAALAGWAPLTGNRWRAAVRVPSGAFPPEPTHLVDVASQYFETMGIGLLQGRDFRPGDVQPGLNDQQQPGAGVGIVNEAFAKAYFDGKNPVGERVFVRQTRDREAPMEIVGLVGDAVYFSVREPMRPTVYLPVGTRPNGTFIVRAAGDPMTVAAAARAAITRARPELRVRVVETQSAFVRQQMIRERLLAALSSFFALVALLLAAIGLYGVLNYAVQRQRREIGIRMALGARAGQVIARIMTGMARIVSAGSIAGLAAGLAFGRVVEGLLFDIKPTDADAVATPLLLLAAAAVLAALPPALRAARIDPAQTLRSD